MWVFLIVLTGLGCLSFSKKFQSMMKNIPISTFSSVVYKYQSFIEKRKFFQGSIMKNIQEAILFKSRVLASKYLDVGKLDTYKSHYEIIYYNGSKRYKVVFSKKCGPNEIVSVKTLKCGKDITNEFLEVMGPSRNFYGIPTTPRLLGYEEGIEVSYRTCDFAKIKYFPDDKIICSFL